jgi:hypothetical protein
VTLDQRDEPWESEIADLLGGLPVLDPPEGFVDRALRHRPLHAGRSLLGLAVASLAALGLLAFSDGGERNWEVPPLDELVARHLLTIETPDVPATAEAERYSGDTDEAAERSGQVLAEIRDLLVAEPAAVSVFVQPGQVRWDDMPIDGRRMLEGSEVWVDLERQVAVFDWDDTTVTLVGMPAERLPALLAQRPAPSQPWRQRVTEVVEDLVVPLGFDPT